jgi:hypothetical protein
VTTNTLLSSIEVAKATYFEESKVELMSNNAYSQLQMDVLFNCMIDVEGSVAKNNEGGLYSQGRMTGALRNSCPNSSFGIEVVRKLGKLLYTNSMSA